MKPVKSEARTDGPKTQNINFAEPKNLGPRYGLKWGIFGQLQL